MNICRVFNGTGLGSGFVLSEVAEEKRIAESTADVARLAGKLDEPVKHSVGKHEAAAAKKRGSRSLGFLCWHNSPQRCLFR
jgi:hypothetical protein